MVLFHLNHWPGAAVMTYSLLAELAVIFVVAIIMASRKILVGKNVLYRVLPLLVLDVFFLLKYIYMF
jgi:hypothetical protein